ncbi:S-layer homology domain-containing protein [Lysinibacillus odysseyi]|uniref:S-layer homology domain-containing protein n=1 Tax=Lysinibacillus odysseyi TaxID=202611 RepID=UPI00068F5669|nr:S-layer homology domain-containing protein [Lysinibacillus odysseyi]
MKQQKVFNIAIASAVAASGIIVAAPTNSEAANAFKDVESTNSHAAAIQQLADRGIIKGYSDGTFRWAKPLTRGQAAKIMANILELDTKNVVDPEFTDVKKTDEYYGAIAALKEKGIISGLPNGSYGQHSPITRGQIAKIIVEAFDLKGSKETPFKDIAGAAGFIDYIETLYANGVTTGTTAYTYSPFAPVKRGQFASFVVRAEEAAQKGEGDNPDTGVDPDVGTNPDPDTGGTPTPDPGPGNGGTPTPDPGPDNGGTPAPNPDPDNGGTPAPSPNPDQVQIEKALDTAIENLLEVYGEKAASIATFGLEDDNTIRISFRSDDLELTEIRALLREAQEGLTFVDLIENIPVPAAALLFDHLDTITVRAGGYSDEFQRGDYFDDAAMDINRPAVIENADRFIDEAHRVNGAITTVAELKEKYDNNVTITIAGVTYTLDIE